MKEQKKNLHLPNIILVVVDDQIIRSLEVLPTIRSQLIEKGTTLSNSFCTSPLCAPARASIFTGKYLHNIQKPNDVYLRFLNQWDNDNTLAIILKNAGYRTIMIGKYINYFATASYAPPPPGWDEWYAFTGKPGYYDYDLSENREVVHYGNKPQDYATDVLARKAYDFIERNKAHTQPIFMYIATYAPHAPRTPAPRHIGKFSHLKIMKPDYEQDISAKPQWVHEDRRIYPIDPPPQAQGEKGNLARSQNKGLESLLAVDEMIEQIITRLDDAGKLENTFIFYFADNGDDLSRHIKATGKLLPYEEGIRTPIIIRGPGTAPASKREHPVSTVDILPTAAVLAGLPEPHFADGRSLLPILSQHPIPLSKWRKAALVEVAGREKWYRKVYPPAYRLLRAHGFKYIEYETGEKEFYDLIEDPEEFSNIYDRLSRQQKKDLSMQLQRMSQAHGKECRLVEDDMPHIYPA